MATMDDDFGELYVDVEIQASSALGVLCNEKEDDHPIDGAKSTSADEKFVIDSVSEDSDSDDDLNIVLNDDDCEKFPVSGAKSHAGGNEEDENGDFGVKDSRSDKTSRRLEPVGDESEFNSSPNGVDRGSGAKIGVHSQFSHFKYMRPHPSNMRVNGCTGVSSFSSMSGRGDLEDDFYSQKRGGSLVQVANRRANTSSHAYQFGYGFSLPWYRTIFDVNMDAFEEKPWRNPGVDITNFFNFGFNEDSWKQYCNSLEEFQKQSSKSTRIPVYYYPKLEQAHEAEAGRKAATEEAMSGGVAELESSFKCADGEEMSLKLPKGRAIHVEDSIIERQPSMDLRCPRFQDSDVIIQITVQDSTVDSSITTKEELGHGGKASESRKLDAEYDSSDDLSKTVRNVSTSSSSGRSVQHKTASNQTSLETNNRGNDKLSKTDRGCHPNMDACFSEAKAIVEAMETKNKELEVPCRNTDQSDPCIVETEPSLEDQSHFSPMISFSECYSAESSEDSVHDASIEVASPSRRQSLAYDTRLQNSVASYIKSSRIDGPKTKSDGGEGYSVHMTTIPDKQKHESWRQRNSVKQRIFLESGDDTSPLSDAEDDRIRFPRCRAPIEERRKHHCGRPNGINDSKIHPKACNDTSLWSNVLELYDSDYSPDYCGRQKGSPQDRGYHDREDFSYYRERGPCADSHLRSVGTKDHLSLKEESDQTVRKSWNQKEFYHKSRVGIDKEDDMGRFWYCGRRLPSQHGLGPYPYRESGRLISRYSSASKQRGIQWRRGNDRLKLRKKIGHNYCLLGYKHEDEWLSGNYGRSIPFAHCERDTFEPYERFLPPIEREVKVSGRNGRYVDAAYFNWDRSSWPMESDDEYQRDMCSRALASDREPSTPNRRRWSNTVASRKEAYDSELIETYNRHERIVCHDEDRDSGWFGYYDCTDDGEDDILQNDTQVRSWRRGHTQRSRLLDLKENTLLVSDRLFAQEVYYSCKKNSRHEIIHARDGSLRDEMHINDLMLVNNGNKMTSKISNADCHKRNSIARYRGEHEQMVLKDRDPADLIIGEGKSSGRHSDSRRLLCNGRLEKIGFKFPMERNSSRTLNDTCGGKAVKTDNPNTDSRRNNEKQLDTFPATECNQDLDIEEGQIISEEQSIGGVNLKKENASETMMQRGRGKRRTMHDNKASANRAVVEYDNKRILETLAKMEKRRERFKDPIITEREPDKTSELQVELVVETKEIKHQRPARKRRWGVS